MRTCSTCSRELTVGDFYRHTNGAIFASCRECVKERVRKRYRTKRSEIVRYDRKREQTPERKAAKLRYQREYRKRNRLEYVARNAVNNAVRDGRLKKEPCVECGSGDSHGHHHDYTKPLDVTWLCKDCHWKRHGGVLAEKAG